MIDSLSRYGATTFGALALIALLSLPASVEAQTAGRKCGRGLAATHRVAGA